MHARALVSIALYLVRSAAAAGGGPSGDVESDAEHGADARRPCPALQQHQERP